MGTFSPINGDAAQAREEERGDLPVVTLTNGVPVPAGHVLIGVAQIQRVVGSPNAQALLRDLLLVAQGQRDQASAVSLRALRTLKVLRRDRTLPSDLAAIVRAAVRGDYPNYWVETEPYELTATNKQALGRAIAGMAALVGLEWEELVTHDRDQPPNTDRATQPPHTDR